MELQAVVMAGGYGDGTSDLSVAKPLLPIGKKKLIWYPINWLAQSGFDHVIIFTIDSMRFDIEEAISDVQIQTKFITIPDRDNFGTLDSLCLLEQTGGDVLVVNCDLITNVQLHKFVDIHRLHDSSVTMLLSSNKENKDNLPGGKALHEGQERDLDIIGMASLKGDESTKRIIFAIDEFDLQDENVRTKREISLKFNKIETRIDLEDVHLYIISGWLLKYILQQKLEGSFRRDLLPFIISKQFDNHDEDDVMKSMNNSNNSDDDEQLQPRDQPREQEEIYFHARKNLMDRHRSDVTDVNISTQCNKSRGRDDVIMCNAMINDVSDEMTTTLCVNNIARFVQANRMLFRTDFPLASETSENSTKIHPSCQIATKVTITSESMVDERTEVNEKTTIKRSIIGKNCKIASNVRISNCILMDHVSIASGCVLQGNVICSNATIHEKCEIRDSFIASNKSVKPNSKFTRESLMLEEMEI